MTTKTINPKFWAAMQRYANDPAIAALVEVVTNAKGEPAEVVTHRAADVLCRSLAGKGGKNVSR